MAISELLLLKPVEGLGNEGEQVKVKTGYARNYLLPRKLAVPLTRANRRQIESLKVAREARLAKDKSVSQELADQLQQVHVAIAVKTGPEGKLFGSVTATDIQERLAEEGIVLERKQLSMSAPVKTLGQQTISVRLHPEIVVDFEFEVVSENPIKKDEKS